MRSPRLFAVFALTGALLSVAASTAQSVAPTVEIVNAIDESKLITLKGNTHPLANAKNDRGRVSPTLPMTDLILVLSRSPQQQVAFDKFVTGQYDRQSPDFHQWLTPDEVGEDFGPSQTDIATISNWLTGHGFSVDEVTRDHMSIRFSGTAAQVEAAFHTEIHNLEVKGVPHIGNMSDPQIPEALAQAVVGVKSLHNFFARPLHRAGSKVIKDSGTGKWQRIANVADDATQSRSARTSPRPQFGINVPASGGDSAYLVEDIVPYDFATIYNILPLWTASKPIDGTGQTIAIAGTSSIVPSDVTTFRSTFGLPAYTSANQPTLISGNSQPVTVCSSTDTTQPCNIDDLTENSLDVEWSGSVAKGANIVLVSSYPSSTTDDNLYDSESYIVNNQTASIMSVSYGLCELYNGTAGNVQSYNLWQTAASEGIAVFVSAGDGGSAECDDGGDSIGNPYSAQFGLAVNGLASTPYNTAVGGTDFNWCTLSTTTACTVGSYWNSTNAANGSSAKGYVPEVPWNDTCANPLALAFLQQAAASESAPTFSTEEGACNFVYNDSLTSGGGLGLAYLIDTVGGAGGASGCVSNDGTTVSSCTSSTTTTGAANGSIPLVADGWPKPTWQAGVKGIPTDGVRDVPDVSFFASDGFLSSSSYLICVSDVAACTYSATAEPLALEVGGTSVSSPAMAGVMALINQKAGEAQGSPNAELYTLAATETYSSCSAESATTGSTCLFNDIDQDTNAVPCDYGASEGNPAQTGTQSPNCTVSTTGDLIGILPNYEAGVGYDQATGLGSLNVGNVVTAWPASTATAAATVTVTPSPTSLSAGSPLSVAVTVAAASSGGTAPTGKVTLLGGNYTSGAQALASGAYTFSIPANSLAAGSDVFTVSYSGDTTYAAATGTATVTVAAASSTAGTGTFTLSATSPASVAPGTSATSTVTVTATGGYAGTASLTCAVTTSPSGAVDVPTCALSPSTVALTTSATSGTVTATITSTAATATTTTQFVRPDPRRGPRGWMGGGAVLAFLVLLGIPARRRSWRSMLGAVALLVALGTLSGCGDFWEAPSGNSADGTTTGTYTFTVTGAGSPTVTAVTTTFTVTLN
jgi:subtilase family serine protease